MLTYLPFLCILLMSLTGCMSSGNIAYQPLSKAPKLQNEQNILQQNILQGDIVYSEIGDAYYQTYPNCVLIAPHPEVKLEQVSVKFIEAVDIAIAKHAFIYFPKLISPADLNQYILKNAYDRGNIKDLRRIARAEQCQALLLWQPWQDEDISLGVWMQKRVGLALELQGLNGEMLWQAKHAAKRSQGALPLSPFSAMAGFVMASQFSMNDEINLSMLDDALRRMMESLP